MKMTLRVSCDIGFDEPISEEFKRSVELSCAHWGELQEAALAAHVQREFPEVKVSCPVEED